MRLQSKIIIISINVVLGTYNIKDTILTRTDVILMLKSTIIER